MNKRDRDRRRELAEELAGHKRAERFGKLAFYALLRGAARRREKLRAPKPKEGV